MRMTVILAALLTGILLSAPGEADTPQSAGAKALIELLAPEVAGPSDPLATPVVRWVEPIRISVVGLDAGTRQRAVDTVLSPLASSFTNVTNIAVVAGDNLDRPNVVFMLIENEAEFQSYRPMIDELFEGDTRYPDAATRFFMGSKRLCAYASFDLQKIYWRATAYIAYVGDDAKFASCVASMMGGVIGLQWRLAAGASIRERGSTVATFSDIDLAALDILYDSRVEPGTRLGDIMPLIEEAGARLNP